MLSWSIGPARSRRCELTTIEVGGDRGRQAVTERVISEALAEGLSVAWVQVSGLSARCAQRLRSRSGDKGALFITCPEELEALPLLLAQLILIEAFDLVLMDESPPRPFIGLLREVTPTLRLACLRRGVRWVWII